MAERRMFAKSIVDSDAFLDMPSSARLLYYDLGMRADDDGFVNAPKKIIRMTGASSDDLNILIAKKFVIIFESGVIVIKAWRINNYLRSDRHTDTKYVNEKSLLEIEENGMYHKKDDDGIPVGIPQVYPYSVSTGKDSIGKDSIGKDSIDSSEQSELSSEPIIKIPLNDGTEYDVTEETYKEFCNLFPAVDVMQELRNMRGWSLSNPKKRKTRSGVMRFMNTWLSKEQDRGGSPSYNNQEKFDANAYLLSKIEG